MNSTIAHPGLTLTRLIKQADFNSVGGFEAFKKKLAEKNLYAHYLQLISRLRKEQPPTVHHKEALLLALYKVKINDPQILQRAMEQFIEEDQPRLRDRKPKERTKAFPWHQPMPWNHAKGQPPGYVQVTGAAPDRIEDFLAENRAKHCGKLPAAGRGRKPLLYPVSINFKVLDAWLGEWTPSHLRTALLCEQIQLLAITPMPSEAVEKQFRKLFLRHVKRVEPKARHVQAVLSDDQRWRAFCERRLREQQSDLRRLKGERIKATDGMAAFIRWELAGGYLGDSVP